VLECCAHRVPVLPILSELGMHMVSAAVSSGLFVLQQRLPQSHQLFLAALRADVREGRPQFIEGKHPAIRANGRVSVPEQRMRFDPAVEQESTRRAFACVRARTCAVPVKVCVEFMKNSLEVIQRGK
jgi:hypothetical protein